MKQMIWFAGLLLLFNVSAQSQTRTKKTKSKQPVQSKTIKNQVADDAAIPSTTIKLNSISEYPAKANPPTLSSSKNRYSISDPILTTLNARANGANIRFNSSGIIGMPKRAYGFANGHILLKSTSAVTYGTQTGSGSVGTGTSLATFGSIGAPMNVNGKSPYAGINMWGNARNLAITKSDSTVRLPRMKKQ